jgi:hypothetical protein
MMAWHYNLVQRAKKSWISARELVRMGRMKAVVA